MKKRILYPLILIIELILFVVIAKIFGFETENTLYALAGVCIIFYTIVCFLIKTIHDYKEKYSYVKLLWFPVAIIAFNSIIIWFIVIGDGMTWR